MAGGEQAMVLMMVGIVLCCLYNLSVIRLHSRVTSKLLKQRSCLRMPVWQVAAHS